MLKQHIVLIIAVLCAAISAGIWGFYSVWDYPHFSIELQVEKRSNIEIFFDSGKGFNADQVSIFYNAKGDHFSNYEDGISFNNITRLRIDLGQGTKHFSIQSVTLSSGETSEVLKEDTLFSRIIQINEITDLAVKNGVLVGETYGNDPFLVIDTGQLSRVHSRIKHRLFLSLTAALLAGGALLFTWLSPGASIISLFIFVVLNIFQQKALISNTVNVDFANYLTLYINVAFGFFAGIFTSRELQHSQNNLLVSQNDVTTFYRAVFLAFTLLIIGHWLDPIFPWLSLSSTLMVIAYSGGLLTLSIRYFLEDLVCDKTSSPLTPSGIIQLTLLVTVVGLIIDRAPSLMTDPRIWAEDGGHYLRAISQKQGLDAVFWYSEYFRILSNFASLVSTRIFELESAAYVFTFTALIVKCIPFLVVIFGNSILWNTVAKKILICLIILYTPMSEEIWLNVNGSHYYMTLATILILAEIELSMRKIRSLTYYLLLAVASLSGILPCAMTPLYWLRAWQLRNQKVLIGAIILTIGSMTQLFLILTYDEIAPSRGSVASAGIAGWIFFIRTILLPINENWAQLASHLSMATNTGIDPVSTGQLLLGCYVITMVVALWILRKSVIAYFLISGIGLVVMTLLFGIGGSQQAIFLNLFLGDRYFFAPTVLFLITFITVLPKLRKYIGTPIATMVMVLTSTFILANSVQLFNSHSPVVEGLPSWSTEIAHWRKHPAYPVKIWPYRWYIRFNKPL